MTINKQCNTCNEILQINMFELTGQYYRNKCNQCRLSDAQKRRKKIKEAVKINIVSKLCINCKNTLNIEMFNKDSSSKDGHDKVCRQCYKITRHKTKKEVNTTISEQQCVKCKTIKNVNEFRTTVRSNTGYFKTCNSCWKPRESCLAIENLEKSNKIIPSIIKRHQIMVSKFLQVNPLPTQIGDNIEGAE